MTAPLEITSDALAALLEHDGHSFVPLPRDLRLRAAMQVSAAARSARASDANAQALRARLRSVAPVLRQDMRQSLEECAILFIESPLPHASLASMGSDRAIIVCRGLFDLIHFRTALTAICAKLAPITQKRPDLDGHTPAEAMMLAGQVALFDAYSTLRTPASIADVLKGEDATHLEHGINASLLLLVLHELGHEALGHAHPTSVTKGLDVIAVPSAKVRARAALEFEADAFAISALDAQWRPQMLASAISLFDIFQFLETFGLRPSREYPPAGERLSAMVNQMHLNDNDQRFARSWLSDYERRRTTIAAPHAQPEDVAKRFDRVLDVKSAYKIMQDLRDEIVKHDV